MSKAAFSNLDNINNIYSIGHSGNIFNSSDEQGKTVYYNDEGGSAGSASNNLYGQMYENNITQSIQNLTTQSHTLRVLMPQIDQIFAVIQSSPFAGLEALGLSNYFDPSKAVGGLSLPKPLSLSLNKKDQSR